MLTEGTTIGPYLIGPLVREDSSTQLFRATTASGPVLLKTGEVDNEALVLAQMRSNADPRFTPYLPNFVGSIVHNGEQINLFEDPEGTWVTLAEVLQAYPNGVDPRDMAWMYRRLLTALGFAHRAGFVNASVLPHTVLIEPEQHGLIVWDWVYAVPTDSEETECIGKYTGFDTWYPPEVGGMPLTPATDLFMAAQVAIALIGGDAADLRAPSHVPPEYNAFFAGSLKLRHEDRIGDAWRALEYFDNLLERLYGRRRFRPFSMPVTTTERIS